MTENDRMSGDYFGSSIVISGDTLLVGAYGKYDNRGATYAFFLAGDGLWDKGTKLGYGISSGDFFGYTLALSGDSTLIGAYGRDEKGVNSGAVYILHRVNGVCQEEAKLVTADGTICIEFGWDVALSGYTSIIGSPNDDNMGSCSGSVYVFIIREGGKWEEVQKLTPTY